MKLFGKPIEARERKEKKFVKSYQIARNGKRCKISSYRKEKLGGKIIDCRAFILLARGNVLHMSLVTNPGAS